MGFCICAIDIFSRKLFTALIRNKSAQCVVPTFEKLLHQMAENAKMPETVSSDRGEIKVMAEAWVKMITIISCRY